MKFVCPIHDQVTPKGTMYSYPAQCVCPKCGIRLEDFDGLGIRIMEEKEGVEARPEFYKKHYPEIYKKYFPNG